MLPLEVGLLQPLVEDGFVTWTDETQIGITHSMDFIYRSKSVQCLYLTLIYGAVVEENHQIHIVCPCVCTCPGHMPQLVTRFEDPESIKKGYYASHSNQSVDKHPKQEQRA